jgi:hypothetical protein
MDQLKHCLHTLNGLAKVEPKERESIRTWASHRRDPNRPPTDEQLAQLAAYKKSLEMWLALAVKDREVARAAGDIKGVKRAKATRTNAISRYRSAVSVWCYRHSLHKVPDEYRIFERVPRKTKAKPKVSPKPPRILRSKEEVLASVLGHSMMDYEDTTV